MAETSTEGNVTTVRTVSGSVWGGTATLEETASIGVESGEDAYMLGSVQAVAEHDGEIFVLDQQVPVIRVYGLDGRHLRDLGREGGGPGELQRPEAMVVGDDGRIYVRDPQNGRIMILSPHGGEVGIMRITSGFSTSNPMVMTRDGTLYNFEMYEQGEDFADWRRAMVPKFEDDQAAGEHINAPDFDFEAPQIIARGEGSVIMNNVPFAPQVHWSLSPSGALIAGVGDDYRFDIRHPDGSVTRVEKSWQPVPVDSEEASWFRRRATANMRGMFPDWTWNGPEIPEYKPAFSQLMPDQSGRIWVARPEPGHHVEEECNEDFEPGEPLGIPCWDAATSWEVFDEEGRFLGEVDLPEEVRTAPRPYIRDDVFLTTAMDDLGTVMVKRYRVVLPGN